MLLQENFYAYEDLKAIFEATGKEIWDKDVQFTAEIYNLIRELKAELPKYGFDCEKCKKQNSQKKVFLEIKIRKIEQVEGKRASKNFLTLVSFKDYINNYVKQLATHVCYPNETIAVFSCDSEKSYP